MNTNARQSLLQTLANQITAMSPSRIFRVGIDGVDGAGKTIFADELSALLAVSGRSVIRASVDSFHNPRAVRYRQGPASPRGFFEDSYNYPLLIETLLGPLAPGGSLRYRKAAFDHRSDSTVSAPEEIAATDSILIFDGIFLHRPELRRFWDFSIFLEVGFDISIPRGAQRGEGSPDPHAESNRRYVEGQIIYLSTCNPAGIATRVINNENLDYPVIVTSQK